MENVLLDDMPYRTVTDVVSGLDENDEIIDIYITHYIPDIVIEIEDDCNKWVQIYP